MTHHGSPQSGDIPEPEEEAAPTLFPLQELGHDPLRMGGPKDLDSTGLGMTSKAVFQGMGMQPSHEEPAKS